METETIVVPDFFVEDVRDEMAIAINMYRLAVEKMEFDLKAVRKMPRWIENKYRSNIKKAQVKALRLVVAMGMPK